MIHCFDPAGRGWPPANVADDALTWFDLQARRSSLRARGEALIAEWLWGRDALVAS